MHAYIFCMCICMCTHMCACTCSGQRSLLIVLPSSSPRYLLTQGVSLNPELKGPERLGSSALQAPPISASPALEFTGAWCHAHFYMCAGNFRSSLDCTVSALPSPQPPFRVLKQGLSVSPMVTLK